MQPGGSHGNEEAKHNQTSAENRCAAEACCAETRCTGSASDDSEKEKRLLMPQGGMQVNKIKSIAIGVSLALALVWCVPNPLLAQSTPQAIGQQSYTTSISCVTGGAATWGSSNVVAAGGACGGRLSSESMKSGAAAIPVGKPFMVWVGCDKGLAADGDSCIVVVETRPNGVTNGPTANRSWTYLGCACSTGDSTDYPMLFHFRPDLDSVNQLGSATLTGMDGGGKYYFRGGSLGQVRVSINGPNADSTADGVGRWPIIFYW
jgi:hypothetical protein